MVLEISTYLSMDSHTMHQSSFLDTRMLKYFMVCTVVCTIHIDCLSRGWQGELATSSLAVRRRFNMGREML